MSKTNEYRKLEDRASKEKELIKDLEGRLSSNQNFLSESEAQLISIKDRLADAVAEGRPAKEIETLEKDRSTIERAIERTSMGIKKLEDRLRVKKETLPEIELERDRFFNEGLAKAWLLKEIKQYDEAYDKLLHSLRRLGACRDLMNATAGGLSLWRETLGPASDYVLAVSVARIQGFSVEQVREIKGRLNPAQGLIDEVRDEILNER